MAYTSADLEAIRRARASGTKRVKFSDREIEYKSDDELAKVERDIVAALSNAAVAGGAPIVRHIYVRQSDRGY